MTSTRLVLLPLFIANSPFGVSARFPPRGKAPRGASPGRCSGNRRNLPFAQQGCIFFARSESANVRHISLWGNGIAALGTPLSASRLWPAGEKPRRKWGNSRRPVGRARSRAGGAGRLSACTGIRSWRDRMNARLVRAAPERRAGPETQESRRVVDRNARPCGPLRGAYRAQKSRLGALCALAVGRRPRVVGGPVESRAKRESLGNEGIGDG